MCTKLKSLAYPGCKRAANKNFLWKNLLERKLEIFSSDVYVFCELITTIILLFLTPVYAGYNYKDKNKNFRESFQISILKTQTAKTDSNLSLAGRWAYGACYAAAVSGNYAFVGNGPSIEILDISSPGSPHKISEISTPGVVNDIRVQNNLIYVADYFGGLRIYDVSNPSSPSLKDFFENGNAANAVYLNGNYAYLADGFGGLQILNISNASNLSIAGNFETINYAKGIFVSENYAYLAVGDSGLKIINISNPQSPVEIGNYTSSPSSPDNAGGVFVSGSYAFLADGANGLLILDITNPQTPQKISAFYDINDIENDKDVFINGNTAYVSDDVNGLKIVDVSNPASPIGLSDYKSGSVVSRTLTTGNYAFLAAGNDGLEILDISNKTNPIETGKFKVAGGEAVGISIDGNNVYLADGDYGVRIFDIKDPSLPKVKGEIETGNYAWHLIPKNNFLFMADGYDGLRIINAANPSNLIDNGNYNPGGYASGLCISGNNLILADGTAGLSIFDISKPSSPSYVTNGYLNEFAESDENITVNGNYAYLAGGGPDILRIDDVSDLISPKLIGVFTRFGDSHSIVLSGNNIFLGINSGLGIIDVSDPSNPSDTGYFETGDKVVGIDISGNYAYLACGYAGVYSVNISDPSNPVEAGYYDTKDYASDIKAEGSYVYVANFDGGVQVLNNSLITNVKTRNIETGKFKLYQNYPNPFNPTTTIKYSIPSSLLHFGKRLGVRLIVYDILGREVATLVNETKVPGNYEVNFNASNLSSGVYFYRLQTGSFIQTKKMILMK